MTDVWTSRDVHFECFPKTNSETFDAFMDTAVDRYWETWRNRLFGTLCIASVGLRLEVGGWPWWVPKWVARRSVAKLAAANDVGGDATFHTSRSVLP